MAPSAGGGWDDTSVSASGMKQVLDAITTPNIDLHMNSGGGGDVFDGTAIHTMIARHPAVVHGSGGRHRGECGQLHHDGVRQDHHRAQRA
jgi:hypothetical protein